MQGQTEATRCCDRAEVLAVGSNKSWCIEHLPEPVVLVLPEAGMK